MKATTSTPKVANTKDKAVTAAPAPLNLVTEIDNIKTGEITTDELIIPRRENIDGSKTILENVQIAKNTKGEILLKETAREIREQYTIALKGIVAWAKMGLVLIAVRNTFPPRGGFVDWMESEFPDLSRRGLYNAIKAGEGILLTAGEKLENLSLDDAEKIESYSLSAMGQTKRLLMESAKTAATPEAEEKARVEVEKLFKLYPDKREQWVPLIEAGERTWCDALRGITGAVGGVKEDGTRREREPYLPLFEKLISIPASIKHAGTWSSIPMESQPQVIEIAAEIMAFIPPALRDHVMRKIEENAEKQEIKE